MNLFNEGIDDALILKRVIKLIFCFSNNNLKQIITIVNLAKLGRLTSLDIIVNSKIVSILKFLTNIPRYFSSIDTIELSNYIFAGADIVKMSNFDIFYNKNMVFPKNSILPLAIKFREFIKHKDICITKPYQLELNIQVRLDKKLDELGIKFLQTHVKSTKNIQPYCNSNIDLVSDNISKYLIIAASSLLSTYAISQIVQRPTITYSGINFSSSSVAVCYGASGICLSLFVIISTNIYAISACINELLYARYNQLNIFLRNLTFNILNINANISKYTSQTSFYL